jgi:hypothetical protein
MGRLTHFNRELVRPGQPCMTPTSHGRVRDRGRTSRPGAAQRSGSSISPWRKAATIACERSPTSSLA